ncbi:UNVERIFIED_ORG: hypothetical protein J2W38_006123 [Variovorax paradoxus]|nr:hypothetical protein [Variovorax paradoxus]
MPATRKAAISATPAVGPHRIAIRRRPVPLRSDQFQFVPTQLRTAAHSSEFSM